MPQIVNLMKILQLANTPELISISVQNICSLLSRIVLTSCEDDGENFTKNWYINLQEKDARPPYTRPPQASNICFAQDLQVLLRTTCHEVLNALSRLNNVEGTQCATNFDSGQENPTPSENCSQAEYQFIQLMAGMVLCIHKNTIRTLQAMTVARPLREYVEQHSGQTQMKKISTQKQAQASMSSLQSISSPETCDLRGELTRFLIYLLSSLKANVRHERNLIEAMVFSLMLCFGTHIVKQPVKEKVSRHKGASKAVRVGKGMGKISHERGLLDHTDNGVIFEQLAREETAWYWLEILDCALRKYWAQLNEESNLSNQSEAGSIISSARSKLREALYEGAFGSAKLKTGSSRWTDSAANETKQPADIRLMNLPVLDELWRLVGFDQDP